MQIFSTNGVITPSQDKTNIKLEFNVPEGTKKLVINYHYSPKHIPDEGLASKLVYDGMKKYDMDIANINSFLPVNNFATLSFDECGEFRGACHRHPNTQAIIIAENDSTPGIINRPVRAGLWDVVLNVHFVGCNIDYSISIDTEVE